MKEQLIQRIQKMEKFYEMANGSDYSNGVNEDGAIVKEFKTLSEEDKQEVAKKFASSLDSYQFTKIGKELAKHT